MAFYPPQMRYLARDYAAVRCKLVCYKPMRYMLDPDPNNPVFLVRAGEEVFELDRDVEVVTENGELINPEGRFFRTTHTINPYHAILDIWDFNVFS